jgi:hypothetical protein
VVDKAELLAAQTGGADGAGMGREESIAGIRELVAGISERREADQGGG